MIRNQRQKTRTLGFHRISVEPMRAMQARNIPRSVALYERCIFTTATEGFPVEGFAATDTTTINSSFELALCIKGFLKVARLVLWQ